MDFINRIHQEVSDSADATTADKVVKTIVSSPALTNAIADAYLEKSLAKITNFAEFNGRRPGAILKFNALVNATTMKALETIFDGIKYVQQGESDRSPHIFARLSSEAFYEHVVHNELKMYGNKSAVHKHLTPAQLEALPSKHKFTLKEVGGLPRFAISRGLVDIHCCQPVISVVDTQRREKFEREYYNHFSQKTYHNNKIAKLYFSNPRFLCSNKSQNCDVRADVLIFRHSMYDMTVDDIIETFMRSSATTGYGLVVFSAEVLVQDDGHIPMIDAHFRKFVRDGKKFISRALCFRRALPGFNDRVGPCMCRVN